MKARGKRVSDRAFARMWSQTGADIEDALRRPAQGPSQIRTLEDMSDEERRELEQRYGAPIRRRRGPS